MFEINSPVFDNPLKLILEVYIVDCRSSITINYKIIVNIKVKMRIYGDVNVYKLNNGMCVELRVLTFIEYRHALPNMGVFRVF